MEGINIHCRYNDLVSISKIGFAKQNYFNGYGSESWKQDWDYTAVIYQINWELAGSGKSGSFADLKEKAFVTASTGKLKY